LDAGGIPYVVGGVKELFSTPEIKAIQAAFFFGLVAVILGLPLSLMVPDLSPIRPGAPAEPQAAPSTAPMD
jgi:hypothetical protein